MALEIKLPIDIEEELIEIFPKIRVGFVSGGIQNHPLNETLWTEVEGEIDRMKNQLNVEQIREWDTVRDAKNAYRMLGKDPNRYRVSAEAMLRRIVSGKGLYQINALVDSLNLLSITTGITIGGFDLDKIEGNLGLSVGRENEPFEAINRGDLNIHRLPVYRDQMGAIGSPTSDCTRTMIDLNTRRFLMIITDFFSNYPLDQTLHNLGDTIVKYVNGGGLKLYIQKDGIIHEI